MPFGLQISLHGRRHQRWRRRRDDGGRRRMDLLPRRDRGEIGKSQNLEEISYFSSLFCAHNFIFSHFLSRAWLVPFHRLRDRTIHSVFGHEVLLETATGGVVNTRLRWSTKEEIFGHSFRSIRLASSPQISLESLSYSIGRAISANSKTKSNWDMKRKQRPIVSVLTKAEKKGKEREDEEGSFTTSMR